jgi:hypothetical protein
MALDTSEVIRRFNAAFRQHDPDAGISFDLGHVKAPGA